MHDRIRIRGVIGVCVAACVAGAAAADSPFATRIIDYSPAPGQFVNNPAFNDPARALGPPVGGGTLSASASSLVTLGGFGGSITLGFDRPIVNRGPTPDNPHGLDFIVFGNAFWAAGDPSLRYAEAAIVEVSRDANGNGSADDAWYMIRGSHLPAAPSDAAFAQWWDDDVADPAFPPALASWVPSGMAGVWSTLAPRLPAGVFELGPVLLNPHGPGASAEGVWGYADCSPTLVLGDTMWPGADAGMDHLFAPDNIVDDPAMTPDRFYTRPDDPFTPSVTPGSGGGDAMDISWAVDPDTGAPANLIEVHFVRITTGVRFVHAVLGEVSAEVDAVAAVRPPRPISDFNASGEVTVQDIYDFLSAWSAGHPDADINGADGVTVQDIYDFLSLWSERR